MDNVWPVDKLGGRVVGDSKRISQVVVWYQLSGITSCVLHVENTVHGGVRDDDKEEIVRV